MKPNWSVLVAFAAAASTQAFAQKQIEVHACTENGGQYTCDKQSFVEVLRAAKTVSIEGPRLDGGTTKQLAGLAQKLGKTVQARSADLVFVLSRTDPDADSVYYGPSDRELATLRVYDRAAGAGNGTLLWVESYRGQPDTPWPTAAHDLIEQFRSDIRLRSDIRQ